MFIERKEDLSIVYWLKDLFKNEALITVLDGFPEEEFILPSVTVDAVKITATNFELGSRIRQHYRLYVIDIFALTKTQRDEITYKIYNELDNAIPVYDYDEGFPPSVNPTQISYLDVTSKDAENIFVSPELTEKLYYRATITFIATRNTK